MTNVHNVTDMPEKSDPRRTRIRTAAAIAAGVVAAVLVVKTIKDKSSTAETVQS